MSDKKYVTIQGLMNKQFQDQKEFINQLNRHEEYEDSIETVDSIKNQIVADKLETKRKTNQFINDIKSDLGEQIKSNPSKVIIIEKTWWEKLKINLVKIFTKF